MLTKMVCMPFFWKVSKTSPGCNIVSHRQGGLISLSTNHIYQSRNKWRNCTKLKQEVNEAQLELNTLSDVAEPFFPPELSPGTTRRRRSMDENQPHNRTRRLVGAVAALAACAGFILGEPIKNAACSAFSIFNLCDSTEDLEQDLDQVTKQQRTQQ